MDVERVRSDFPILARQFHGRPLVYLDSAATSQKPRSVFEAEAEYYREHNANVHRGVYALSEEATDAYEHSREHVARFLHARSPEEIVFTRGTTESLNLVASSLSYGTLGRGDRVLTTILEHHSNIVPWQLLRSRHGIQLDFVDIDAHGRVDLDQYRDRLSAGPKVVTLSHVSNVLGTVNPIREMAELAHARGAIVVVDAAQSVPHRAVDVQALGIDLLAFSGHKALGPMGIGALWGRSEILRRLPPYMGGGEMIREVHTDRVAFQDPPARFEAGTPNVGGAIALSAGLAYLESIGFDEIRAHEDALVGYAFAQAEARFGARLRLFGPPPGPDRDAIFSFALEGVHPHDVASIVDAEGVCIRSGHHCAQPLMDRLGVSALSRASAYLYTTRAEFDRLFDALGQAERVFQRAPARPAG
jgi:cysteine desulfurase/selenocysteine lyase